MKSKIKFKKSKLNKYYQDGFCNDISEFISTYSFAFDIDECKKRSSYIKNHLKQSNFLRTLESLVYLYGKQSKYLSYRNYLDLIKDPKLVKSSIEILVNIQTVTQDFNVLCFGKHHYDTFLYDKRTITEKEILEKEQKYLEIAKLGSTKNEKRQLIKIFDISSSEYFKPPYDQSNHKIMLAEIINFLGDYKFKDMSDVSSLLVLTKKEESKINQLIASDFDSFKKELNNPLNLHIKMLFLAMREASTLAKNIEMHNVEIFKTWSSLFKKIATGSYDKYNKQIKLWIANEWNLRRDFITFLAKLPTWIEGACVSEIEKNIDLKIELDKYK